MHPPLFFSFLFPSLEVRRGDTGRDLGFVRSLLRKFLSPPLFSLRHTHGRAVVISCRFDSFPPSPFREFFFVAAFPRVEL